MTTRNRFTRILSLIVVLAMVMTFVPSFAAAAGGTVTGDKVTVTVGNDEITGRDNNFNKGWKFYLGDNGSAQNQNFDDSSWENVNLPHDFSIIQHFTASGEAESGFLPGGTGWYRKTFTMPDDATGKTVLLNFDGAYMHSYVYVNGTFVGEHHFGYSNFAFDITNYLSTDGSENVIAVKVVNNVPSSRWYSGSGIYRDVTMIVTDPVHVDLHGTKITTPDISKGTGTVKVENTIVNDGTASASVSVKTTVYKGASAVANATKTGTVAAGSSAAIETTQTVASPALWSTETPNLYKVVTEVSVDGKVVDATTETFGFRWFGFNSQGFQLNGKNVKLDGVCLHHDQGAAGSAAYYDAMYRQISIMKEMGCNAIRTSHNPADEHFIEICNELGMLVIEENFDGLTIAKNGNSYDFSTYFERPADSNLYGVENGMICAEYAVRSIVKRDRNAPAVFAWSYGNEIQEGASAHQSFVTYCQQYINWINDEDGTRIATIGDNSKAGNGVLQQVLKLILDAGGVAGFNYHCHQANAQNLVNSWGGDYGCFIASETSSHVNSRGFYKNQASASTSYGYHLTSYDTSAVGWGDTSHDSMYDTYTKDYIAGEFVWTGFDYIGEPTPWNGVYSGDSGRGAVPNSSYFGIVETTGFPKDNYYLYRAQWHDSATTLHLVTAWDSDNMMTTSDGKTPVWVYSNAPVVKLYLNDNHIGTTTRTVNTTAAGHKYYTYRTETANSNICSVQTQSGADSLYSIFNVAYQAGTISAKAFESDGKTEITLDENSGTTSVSTPGAVSKLVVSQDKTTVEADGSSLVYVTVDVTDAKGNLDTTATNNISFTVSGPGEIVGVDNGDQATVRKYQNAYVKTSDTTANINAYAGKALVIIRSTEENGTITVNASASGLTGGKATINASGANESTGNAIVGLSMVKDYSVKAGTKPTLDTSITAVLADGSTVNGTVTWGEIKSSIYNNAGDYVIEGTASFKGHEDVAITARLHVIPKVIAMRNISTAVQAGFAPFLPSTVKGVLADGTLAIGNYAVAWGKLDVTQLNEVGNVVVISGTATVLGDETLPVTCTVRVAETVEAGVENIAPAADGLMQDIPAGSQSDKLESVNNEVLKPGDNTNERWTNWNYRTTKDNATITMTWATAHLISSIDLYYYYDNCCAKPSKVEFAYSNDMTNFVAIGATESEIETYSLGGHYRYTFENPVDPVAVKIKLTQQNGTSGSNCVGLTEIEVNSARFVIEPNASADLSGITVNGKAVADFAADKTEYEVEGDQVAATTAVNAGITVLPEYCGIVRILTVSEDGSEAMTYAVQVGEITEPPTEATTPEDTTPEDTKPEDTKPEASEPDASEPDASEPDASEPEYTVPECDKDDNCTLSQFEDIKVDDWYHDGIHFCVNEGIMNGMGEGKFAPNENTTRAQLVMMLYRLAGTPSVEGKTEPFTDVADTDWFYAPIVWAYENKVVNGVTATEFAPNAGVTREQVATILHRYLGEPEGTGKLEEFPDVADVSAYAVAPLTWAVGEGLITGIAQADGTALLAPTGNATRAQIATILMRHLTK